MAEEPDLLAQLRSLGEPMSLHRPRLKHPLLSPCGWAKSAREGIRELRRRAAGAIRSAFSSDLRAIEAVTAHVAPVAAAIIGRAMAILAAASAPEILRAHGLGTSKQNQLR